MTHDDSWVATVLSGTRCRPVQLARHPMRHVLTNVVGARDETEVEVGERTLQAGERCCSAATASTARWTMRRCRSARPTGRLQGSPRGWLPRPWSGAGATISRRAGLKRPPYRPADVTVVGLPLRHPSACAPSRPGRQPVSVLAAGCSDVHRRRRPCRRRGIRSTPHPPLPPQEPRQPHRRPRGPDRVPRRQLDRRPGLRPRGVSRMLGETQNAAVSTTRSSTPACRATRRPVGCAGSTGRSTATSASWSSRSVPTTACAACRSRSCGGTSRAIIERRRPTASRVLLAGMEAPPNFGPAYTRSSARRIAISPSRYDVAWCRSSSTAWRASRR